MAALVTGPMGRAFDFGALNRKVGHMAECMVPGLMAVFGTRGAVVEEFDDGFRFSLRDNDENWNVRFRRYVRNDYYLGETNALLWWGAMICYKQII